MYGYKINDDEITCDVVAFREKLSTGYSLLDEIKVNPNKLVFFVNNQVTNEKPQVLKTKEKKKLLENEMIALDINIQSAIRLNLVELKNTFQAELDNIIIEYDSLKA